MNKECQIVQDLLPLYAENMVSEASRELVEKHLENCQICRCALNMEKQPLKIPEDTDLDAFRQVKKNLRKRTLFPVLLTVFLALTVFCGLIVYAIIPVWVYGDETILGVELTEDGQIRVQATDEVCGIVSLNNVFCFEKRRLDWLYTNEMKQYREQNKHWFYFSVEEGESLWYSGRQTGHEDILIWGDGEEEPDPGMAEYMDKTLIYLCICSISVGLLLLVPGILFRKKTVGKLMLHVGVISLFCGLSCLFVTDGHLLAREVRSRLLRYERLPQTLIATSVMTVLCYLCFLFGEQTFKAFKK